MNKPTCIIMCGLPGSGKDYWINEFIKDSDKEWVIVSTDMHIESYAELHGITYGEAFNLVLDGVPMYDIANKLMNADVDRFSREGRNIIWNQTNMARSKRDKIRRRLGKKYNFLVKHIEVSEHTLMEQLLGRSLETGKTVPWSVIEGMIKQSSPVTADENILTV